MIAYGRQETVFFKFQCDPGEGGGIDLLETVIHGEACGRATFQIGHGGGEGAVGIGSDDGRIDETHNGQPFVNVSGHGGGQGMGTVLAVLTCQDRRTVPVP